MGGTVAVLQASLLLELPTFEKASMVSVTTFLVPDRTSEVAKWVNSPGAKNIILCALLARSFQHPNLATLSVWSAGKCTERRKWIQIWIDFVMIGGMAGAALAEVADNASRWWHVLRQRLVHCVTLWYGIQS